MRHRRPPTHYPISLYLSPSLSLVLVDNMFWKKPVLDQPGIESRHINGNDVFYNTTIDVSASSLHATLLSSGRCRTCRSSFRAGTPPRFQMDPTFRKHRAFAPRDARTPDLEADSLTMKPIELRKLLAVQTPCLIASNSPSPAPPFKPALPGDAPPPLCPSTLVAQACSRNSSS